MTELLVAMAVVLIFLGLTVPAVLHAQEAARRLECHSHLRQLGLALHEYEALHSALPAGRDAGDGRDHSWTTAILPYLEQSALASLYSYGHKWNDDSPESKNQRVAHTTLPLMLCPSTSHAVSGLTDYGGNYGSSLSGLPSGFGVGQAWNSGVLVAVNTPSRTEPQHEPVTLAQVSDGLSQTFLVLEDAGRLPDRGGRWADGNQCLAHEYEAVNTSRMQGIYSDHPGGASALMVDASVLFLSDDTDSRVLGACSTRAHGEDVDFPGG